MGDRILASAAGFSDLVPDRRHRYGRRLFKNPRDSRAITVLGSQMFPGRKGFLTSAFADATKEPYSYLVVNAHQSTKEDLRVIGNLFDAARPAVYTPK